MTLAFLVSRFLDPMWIVPAITVLGARYSGLEDSKFIRFLLILVVFMLGIPLLLRLRFTKAKGLSGWDIKNRADRPKAIAVLLFVGLLNVTLARIFGNASLVNLFVFYELWLVGYLIISLKWKISGHAGGIALATGLAIGWFGWRWWPILFFVPLIGWARVVTKDHTIAQVIAGALYSWCLLIAYHVSRLTL
ncbi:hypothetical protein HY032_00940 [Candidatus Gottesmanbacteria bacterium]|nr:hypothetical protein [Candidatus Gottesmanbacteria bacterium]